MKNVTPCSQSSLLRGLLLMGIGGYLLLSNLGYGLPFSLLHFLPIPFIAAGIWGLVLPGRHMARRSGAWILTVGIYLACSVYELFGLSWGTAWPIFLVGLGTVIAVGHDVDCRGCGDDDTKRDRVIHGA
jgi:hypothetical protein